MMGTNTRKQELLTEWKDASVALCRKASEEGLVAVIASLSKPDNEYNKDDFSQIMLCVAQEELISRM